MFRKTVALTLALLMIQALPLRQAFARSRTEKDAEFTEKVRIGVSRIGVGPEAWVELKLRDKSKIKGYISEAGNDSFVVKDSRTGAATTVAYPDVAQIKGNHFNEKTKVAIIIVVIVAAGIGFYELATNRK